MSVTIDLVKTVEVARDGLGKLTPAQLGAITTSAFIMLGPWWMYRFSKLAISEIQQLRKDALESSKLLRETTQQILALQHKTIQAVHSAHESIISACPQIACSLESASDIRRSRNAASEEDAALQSRSSPETQSPNTAIMNP